MSERHLAEESWSPSLSGVEGEEYYVHSVSYVHGGIRSLGAATAVAIYGQGRAGHLST